MSEDPKPSPRLDTRKTSPEKLTAIREIANEMARVSAREPNNEAAQKLGLFADRIHRVLDGEFL